MRDAWTKLNVSPAKIMLVENVLVKNLRYFLQQEQVLSKLYSYIHKEPPPADASSTSETLKYLQACHQLFETGFLSHKKIISLDSPVLQSIDKGYKYLTSWLSTLLM